MAWLKAITAYIALRSLGRAALALGERPSGVTGRLGRRLLRAGDDRVLAARLEGWLGVRGVGVVETTNFVLLLVVLATLLIEQTCSLSPAQEHVLHWVDALACSFFLLD